MGSGQGNYTIDFKLLRFQFIEFPSEWGEAVRKYRLIPVPNVSNLLSSPASGEMANSPEGPVKALFPIY